MAREGLHVSIEQGTPLKRAWALCAHGNYAAADALLQESLTHSPRDADAWSLFARVRLQLGDGERAQQAAALSVRLAPDNAANLYLLGRTLGANGHLAAAETAYRRSLALEPANADALVSLAVVARKGGRLEESVALYRRALEVHPGHAAAVANLQAALTAAGAGADARVRIENGRPVFSDGLIDSLRAAATRFAGELRLGEALTARRIAIQFRPEDAGLWFEASDVALDTGMMAVTLELCEEGLRRDPTHYGALQRARGISAAGGLDECALRHLAAAEAIRPGGDARLVGAIVLPAIQRSAGSITESRNRYEAGLDAALAGTWSGHDDYDLLQIPNFYLAYHGRNDRDLQVKAARMFLHAMPSLAWVAPHCRQPGRRAGRIRIGIISRYLASHSIGKTTRGLVEKLDRERFEVFAIRIMPGVHDEVTRSIMASADHAVTLSRQVPQAREQIAALELDILFYQDIGMEPTSWFLAFARLAPVQCVSFGHPNTTGIPTIDYFVSNDLYELPGAESHYSERLFLLQDLPTLAYYYKPEVPAAPPPASNFGLPPDATLYVCPQTLFKLHPDFDAVIGGILARDPRGVVVLIRGDFSEWTEALQRRFAAAMPAVCDRIEFVPRLQKADFLGLLAAGAVVLDTIHFNGMNSSLEAFAVGTPIVTLPTGLQRGRHTQAMYRKMGIGDCIARSIEDYVDIAVRLGTDAAFRQDVRERILARNHVLYEDPRVVREFERFFAAAVSR